MLLQSELRQWLLQTYRPCSNDLQTHTKQRLTKVANTQKKMVFSLNKLNKNTLKI